MDCSLPGSSVHGILQARMREWVAMSSSRGSSQPRDQTHVSLMSPALAGRFFSTEPRGRPLNNLRGTQSSQLGFPNGSDGKESACSTGDLGLIPGLGRSPGEGNGNPLQYSCLENSMDRGTWQATVHGVPESRT